MKYRIVFLVTAIILFAAACDRFDNKFEPEKPDTSFQDRIEDFGLQLETSLKNADLTPALAFYCGDYLYDGRTKDDVEAFFQAICDDNPDNVNVTIKEVDKNNLSFIYSIEAYKDESLFRDSMTLIDSTIVEYAAKREDNYLIVGNRKEAIISPDRNVLVELFTGLWCPNCPYVEGALSELKCQYGDNLSYVEYHLMDKFDKGNNDIKNYYGAPSLPVGIIQGSTRISGGSETESINQYQTAISQYLGKEADFFFKDFSYRILDENLSITLKVTANSQIFENVPDREKIQVKYALLEKESSETNKADEPIKNIVIAKGDEQLISFDDVGDSGQVAFDVKFTIPIPDYEFENPGLTVWLQTVETPYNADTCLVHNVQEFEIKLIAR